MSMGELLGIEPLELKFSFELKKQISCSLQLSNKTDSYVAFKVKTTNPKKYCVRPNAGVVLPRSTCDIIVTMQAQKEAPPDLQCRDKFLLQSVKVDDGVTAKDITSEMFNKEAGHQVEECKLRVLYVSPPQPPSPVPEGSEEGSPRGSVSDNGNGSEFVPTTAAFSQRAEPQSLSLEQASKGFVQQFEPQDRTLEQASKGFVQGFEPQDRTLENSPLISKLTEQKNNAIQLNNKLRQELELLRREGSKTRGGVSFMFVIFVGLLGIFLGYLMKRT